MSSREKFGAGAPLGWPTLTILTEATFSKTMNRDVHLRDLIGAF